jgi:hypothetical protein
VEVPLGPPFKKGGGDSSLWKREVGRDLVLSFEKGESERIYWFYKSPLIPLWERGRK